MTTEITFNFGERFNGQPYIQLPLALLADDNLTHAEKIVMIFIAAGGWKSGLYYTKQKTIAKACALTETGVSLIIKSLVKKKYLNVIKPQGSGRLHHLNNNYEFIEREYAILNKEKIRTKNKTAKSPGIKQVNVGALNELSPNIIDKCITNKCIESSLRDDSMCAASRHPVKAAHHAPVRYERTTNKAHRTTERADIDVIKTLPRISPPIIAVMEYWTELGLHKHPAEDTQSYKNTMKKIKRLLRGGYNNKKYTVEEIQKTIHNFYLAATDERYEPASLERKLFLKKVRLCEFIENEHTTKGNTSYFRTYFESPPKPTKEIIESKNHRLTNRLKRLYIEKSNGGVSPDKFSIKDENCFALATNKMIDWAERNRGKINMHLFNDAGGLYGGLIDMMIETLDKEMHGDWSKVQPSWLCSQRMFDWRLPAYLNNQAAIVDDGSYRMPYSYDDDICVDLYDEM